MEKFSTENDNVLFVTWYLYKRRSEFNGMYYFTQVGIIEQPGLNIHCSELELIMNALLDGLYMG
jgi:hypothetical protein